MTISKSIKKFYGVFILLISYAKGNSKDEFYTKFAVNTELEIASEIGKKILMDGGNAIDAAIAASLAIGTVNSFSSGIGGGGFMLIMKKDNDGNDNVFDMIDFRETAPEKSDINIFIKNPELTSTTGLSVAIPGEIMGYYTAHKKYGKLQWNELFKDSIELAKGFPASKILIQKLKKNKKYILNDPGLKEVYSKDGNLIVEGDLVSRNNYSKTLKILSEDPMSFYTGEIAQKIIKFIKTKGGIFLESDLKNYKALTRKVIQSRFYDYKVFTTNLPSSGIFIVEALNILERLNIKDLVFMANNENFYYIYHILIETLKFVISNKEKFGDPKFIKQADRKVSMIISHAYARRIARKLKIDKILSEDDYGFDYNLKEDHGTTHLNVVDKDGNIASLTSTINLEFGSKICDPDTGIIFNNHMDDFYYPDITKRGKKSNNMMKANKRPLSSASPLILIGEDDIVVAGGSGGSRITSSLVFFLGYLISGKSIEECIRSCRIHTQIYPNTILVEPTINDSIMKKLISLGHKIDFSEINTSFTSIQAIHISNLKDKNKKIYAVSDFRKEGKSAGI